MNHNDLPEFLAAFKPDQDRTKRAKVVFDVGGFHIEGIADFGTIERLFRDPEDLHKIATDPFGEDVCIVLPSAMIGELTIENAEDSEEPRKTTEPPSTRAPERGTRRSPRRSGGPARRASRRSGRPACPGETV